MGTSVGIIARKLPLDLGFAGPVYVSAVLCYTSFAIRAPGDVSQVYPFWREVFPTAYATGVGMHAVFQVREHAAFAAWCRNNPPCSCCLPSLCHADATDGACCA